MFTLDITKWLPRFILNDKNGYAIAKAIEAGLQIMNDTVDQGVKAVTDSNYMPEWRLDEMAWEYNILYDYSAPVSAKRVWIQNAVEYYAKYGTPSAIKQYLNGVYDTAVVEEFWQYGGQPYHFRVTVTEEWTSEADAWTQKAIAAVKNVRSVLDSITFSAGSLESETLHVAAAVTGVAIETAAQNEGG